jgi:hypothetical protein
MRFRQQNAGARVLIDEQMNVGDFAGEFGFCQLPRPIETVFL